MTPKISRLCFHAPDTVQKDKWKEQDPSKAQSNRHSPILMLQKGKTIM
jgi:hypothetical protein